MFNSVHGVIRVRVLCVCVGGGHSAPVLVINAQVLKPLIETRLVVCGETCMTNEWLCKQDVLYSEPGHALALWLHTKSPSLTMYMNLPLIFPHLILPMKYTSRFFEKDFMYFPLYSCGRHSKYV